MHTEQTIYDMLIIGGGPGGYTAALYAARAGLRTLVLEKLSPGGQMALTSRIDNYPGFDEGIDGFTLGEKMKAGAERFGTMTRIAEVFSLDLRAEPKRAETSVGTFYGRTLVLATGASPRRLELPGEKELTGRGISYCAACDGMFYRGKTVAVIGGGNTAAVAALQLIRMAKKVIVVHRRDSLRATRIYHEPLMKAHNVEFVWNSTVSALVYDEKLTGITLLHSDTGKETYLPCDGVFVSIGRAPATELVNAQLSLDAAGYVVADASTKTDIPGVFAVGDVRAKALRQIVTAAADGAAAAHWAEQYLAEQISG